MKLTQNFVLVRNQNNARDSMTISKFNHRTLAASLRTSEALPVQALAVLGP
jgi:hypothetical protein